MRWLSTVAYSTRSLFTKKKLDAQLSEEIQTHVDLATEANIAQGMAPEDARYAALREFGNVASIQQQTREGRGWIWLEQFSQDVRYAGRAFGKSPGFTMVAVLTLAVAISVNCTVFSFVNGFLLRPLVPLRPAELVDLFTIDQPPRLWRSFSHAEYLILRGGRETFADVVATFPISAGIAEGKANRPHGGYLTSENFFSMLGVAPIQGRYFTAEECRPNANIPVVVASYTLWQNQGARSDFVGSTLRLNGKPYTVIGIAPKGFTGLKVDGPAFWAPLGVFSQFNSFFNSSSKDLAEQKSYTLYLTARLAPEVTRESLPARFSTLAQRLMAVQAGDDTKPRILHAETPARMGVRHFPNSRPDPIIFLSLGLFSIASCVLLIASFNLGNMLLARGLDRAREIAVRLALGATRGRIIRQLLAEGLLIGCTGGILGFCLSQWGIALLIQSCAPLTLTDSTDFLHAVLHPDDRVLVSAVACSLGATFLFSLVPALKVSRVNLVHDLKQEGGESAAPGRFNRFFAPRHLLLMGQIALSLAVVFCAGLFVRGALKADGLALGFDPTDRLAAGLDYSLTNMPSAEAQRSLFAAVDRIRAQPGVQYAAASSQLPYGNMISVIHVQPVAGISPADAAADFLVSNTAATPGYFDSLGVQLLRGRDFTDAEARDATAPRVAIVDESLARRLFPQGDALGQRIRYTERSIDGSPAEMEIVGICATHRQGVTEQLRGADLLYVPYATNYRRGTYRGSDFILVRYASGNSAAIEAAVEPLRTALHDLDPDLPLMQILPFATFLEQNTALSATRMGAIVFGVFGLIALLLAAIGAYGVKAYNVTRRTREIGIRIALGATRTDVLALIVQQGFFQILVGLGFGLFLAFASGQLLGSLVYQISPTDPLTLVSAAMLLVVSTLFACWLPARRAAKVDPMIALRDE